MTTYEELSPGVDGPATWSGGGEQWSIPWAVPFSCFTLPHIPIVTNMTLSGNQSGRVALACSTATASPGYPVVWGGLTSGDVDLVMAATVGWKPSAVVPDRHWDSHWYSHDS